MFGWCCQVPELATIKTVETTVWSANGVRTRFGPLLDNTSPSCRWTCWPVWSGGRSQVLRSWYFSCVRWWACRFLWTAVSWGVWEESSGRLDLSCQEYRSLAEEGRLLSMGVVRRHSRERSGSVLLCLTLSMVFLTVWTMHSANPLDWGIWVNL